MVESFSLFAEVDFVKGKLCMAVGGGDVVGATLDTVFSLSS